MAVYLERFPWESRALLQYIKTVQDMASAGVMVIL